jgi:hypothetical protein
VQRLDAVGSMQELQDIGLALAETVDLAHLGSFVPE